MTVPPGTHGATDWDPGAPGAPSPAGFDMCRARYGTFPECPLCGTGLIPEHAHFKCTGCGWRDSCCD